MGNSSGKSRSQKRSNDDVANETVQDTSFTTCDIVDSTLTNCTLRKCDFKGQVRLVNCDVRETDIYGAVTVSGGKFEWSEVKAGGSLRNDGGCRIKDVDGYYGN